MSQRKTVSHKFHDALRANRFLSGRNVRVENEGGRLILKGEVSTFYQAQMAQETIRQVDHQTPIENQLHVKDYSGSEAVPV